MAHRLDYWNDPDAVCGRNCGSILPHAHCPGCGYLIPKAALLCGRCFWRERGQEARGEGLGEVARQAEAEADAYRALDRASEQHRDNWEGLSDR